MQEMETVQAEVLAVFNALPGVYILLLPDAPWFTVIAPLAMIIFHLLLSKEVRECGIVTCTKSSREPQRNNLGRRQFG